MNIDNNSDSETQYTEEELVKKFSHLNLSHLKSTSIMEFPADLSLYIKTIDLSHNMISRIDIQRTGELSSVKSKFSNF